MSCKAIGGGESILPGWGCCGCSTYNGLNRQRCKACGHGRCSLADSEGPVAKTRQVPSGYRPEDVEQVLSTGFAVMILVADEGESRVGIFLERTVGKKLALILEATDCDAFIDAVIRARAGLGG